jgi:hypothetical protein
MYVCMYACMYVCMYACMYVCMYVCTNKDLYSSWNIYCMCCMYVCMYGGRVKSKIVSPYPVWCFCPLPAFAAAALRPDRNSAAHCEAVTHTYIHTYIHNYSNQIIDSIHTYIHIYSTHADKHTHPLLDEESQDMKQRICRPTLGV